MEGGREGVREGVSEGVHKITLIEKEGGREGER